MSDIPSPHEILTDRELTVVRLMAEGLTNAEIAQRLVIALTTVKWYARQINEKLGVSSRTKAVAKARQLDLLGHPVEVAATVPHNLPAERVPFIGRQQDRHTVGALLRTARLVTLTGVGGAGKTRLALKIALDNLEAFPDGVWVVFLGALTEPSQVMPAIARTLGLREPVTGTLQESVQRFLLRKRLLLVLDNFEHVLPAATMISDLSENAPQLTVLVTSREALNLYGEHEYNVNPLAVPAANGPQSMTQLADIESVQLFLQSARAVLPDFQLTEDNYAIVAQICAQLEGLPLSIELSAARLRVFRPEQLLERLTNRLSTLVGGPQDLPHRQRALRSTIEWSYNLLTPDEQSLFESLAVLRAGCTLEAVEAVMPGHTSWELLESLIRKNLILHYEGSDGQIRFRMLETIRDYALERLQASSRYRTVWERYSEYYAAIAENAQPHLRGGRLQYQWFEYFEAELSNVHEVLEWAFASDNPWVGMRLAGALVWFWWRRGYGSHGRYWLKLGLDSLTPSTSDPLKARLLLGAGILEWSVHHLTAAVDYLDSAIALFRRLGDDLHVAWSLIFRAAADIGNSETYQTALALCDDGIKLLEQAGDRSGLAQALNIKGELARVQGDYHLAKGVYEACLQIAEEIDDRGRIQMLQTNLGFIALYESDTSLARDLFKESLLLAESMNSKSLVAISLAGIASVLAVQERWISAVSLMAAATSINTILGTVYPPGDKPAIEHYLNTLRSYVSSEEFGTAWASGSAMSSDLNRIIQFALSHVGQP